MADGGEGPERPRCDRYVLQGKKPVPEPDLMTWAAWMGDCRNTRVRRSQCGSWIVSTIFLGLDHSFGGDTPILFETMVFFEDRRKKGRTRSLRSRLEQPWRRPPRRSSYDYQHRTATWTAALLAHQRVLRTVHKVRAHVLDQRRIDFWEP